MAEAAPAARKEQARSRETRQRLLDAAIACLAETGYAGLTTQEVARRAGVSRGAQLHHYRTKQALVRAAIERLDWRRAAEFQRRLSRLRAAEDPIGAAVEALWKVALGPLAYAELALLAGVRTDPELRSVLAPYVERRRQFSREAFRPALGGVVDSPDFEALVSTLFDALRGVAMIRTLGGRRQLEKRQLALLKRFARDTLRDLAEDR
jgi:AcrR family transcriptional regulator